LRQGREPVVDIDPIGLLSPEQRARVALVAEASNVLELLDSYRIEPWGDGWVVKDKSGYFLVGIEQSEWARDCDDPAMQPIMFDSPEKALAAFVYSMSLAAARADRYEAARRQLDALDRSD
jgi:hypothetical protein